MQWISYDAICLAITRPWRCHAKETLSSLLALCEGNPSFSGRFSSQKVSNLEIWWTSFWTNFDRCVSSILGYLNAHTMLLWRLVDRWFTTKQFPCMFSLRNCLRRMHISAWIDVTVQKYLEIFVIYFHNVTNFKCLSKIKYENLVLMICVQIALALTQVLDRLQVHAMNILWCHLLSITKQVVFLQLTVHLGQYKQGFDQISRFLQMNAEGLTGDKPTLVQVMAWCCWEIPESM